MEQEQLSPQAQTFQNNLNSFLVRTGWNNEETRKKFIASTISFVTNAKTINAQQMITNYMDRGMDVLSIELKRTSMEDNQIDEVNPDRVDIDEDDNIRTESFNKMKNLMVEFKDYINDKYDKKTGTKIFEAYSNSLPNSTNPKKTFFQTYSKLLRENSTQETRGKANENNFRIFMKNHLIEGGAWDDEKIQKLINSTLSVINNFTGDVEAQMKINQDIDTFEKKYSKYLKTETDESNNLSTALTELNFYAVNYRGWSSNTITEFINFIRKVSHTKLNSKVQRLVASFLQSLSHNPDKNKPKEQSKSEPEADEAKETSKEE